MRFQGIVIWTAPDSSRDVQRSGIFALSVAPEVQRPQPGNRDRIAAGVAERAQRRAGNRIERIDFAVAEISDQERAGKQPEIRWRDCHAPWSVEWPSTDQIRDQHAALVESRDISVTRPAHAGLL